MRLLRHYAMYGLLIIDMYPPPPATPGRPPPNPQIFMGTERKTGVGWGGGGILLQETWMLTLLKPLHSRMYDFLHIRARKVACRVF